MQAGAHDGIVFTQGAGSAGQSQPSSEQEGTALVNVGPGQVTCCYSRETGHMVDDYQRLAANHVHEHAATEAVKETETQMLMARLDNDNFDDQSDTLQDWLFFQHQDLLFGVSTTLRSGLPSYVFKYRQRLQPTRRHHHELSESVRRLRPSSRLAYSPLQH